MKIISGWEWGRRNLTLVVGVALLALAAWALWWLVYNSLRYERAAYGWQSTGDPPLHFKVKCTGNRTYIDFRGQKVLLWDQFKMSNKVQDGSTFDNTQIGTVHIQINGRDYTNQEYDSSVEIRTEADDANRYWSQVMVAELTDKREGTTRLAILQSYPRVDYAHYHLNSMKCRILFVDGGGHVEEDVFSFGRRNYPFYRGYLAEYVSPQSLGLMLQGPVLYVLLGGPLGLIFTMRGVILAQRRRE